MARVLAGTELNTELAAGYLGRHGTGASDWIGRAAIGVRLSHGMELRARSERAAYLWTLSSLETPIMSDTYQGVFALNRSGWLAEAAFGVERYPDANKVWNAYGWLLAPLVRREWATLQAGYSLAFTDSDESRWTPAAPGGSGGRYDPYYTPEELHTHSVYYSGNAAIEPVDHSACQRGLWLLRTGTRAAIAAGPGSHSSKLSSLECPGFD